MSRLTDLIAQAKRDNPRLGAALEQEFYSQTQRTFGLVFERHLPEKVELPGRPIRRGDIVHILPKRGSLERPDSRTWCVISTHKDKTVGRIAQLIEAEPAADTTPELRNDVLISDLVVVAQQDDVIYPGLRQTDEIINSDDPDTPFHSVINAENYHALKMLTYTHYQSVDCIYIDPPYNTGAKDWKYNNAYVDSEDNYRHSKWLSFMERRLLVAKQLLNPADSVLIVTIDEKEYLRLGMLLEQTFPEANIQMVSVTINPNGVARGREFYRIDEYIFFVYFGTSGPQRTTDPLFTSEANFTASCSENSKPVRWERLMRGGSNSERSHSPGCFYPVYVNPETRKIEVVGEPLSPNLGPESAPQIDGLIAVLPISVSTGTEKVWRMTPANLRALCKSGYARVGSYNAKKDRYSLSYLGSVQRQRIESGEIIVTGFDENGVAIAEYAHGLERLASPMNVWNRQRHNAGEYGSKMLISILGDKRFTYPKSLYAVEDALRFFVKDKPDATILDFFSGSGTTAHAVMRLNKQDGGRRRSISVTNNEVSTEEQTKLRKEGLRPGDTEWEKWGICDYVTKPRIEAVITGLTPEGKPIKGDYKFTDEFPMADGFEANARFFTLTYEPPARVRHGMAFKEIAPMLWLRAGQTGRIITKIPDCGWDITESYGVIENVAASKEFIKAVAKNSGVKVIYIVTNDDLVFESMARELAKTDAELVRLYSTYLNNFAFQQARENN